MQKRSIKDVELKNKVVLLRADYNVPLENGKITNDFRITSSLSTIKYLLNHSVAKIAIISHLGRPDGKKEKSLSLAPVAQKLQELLPETPVEFIRDVSGPDVELAVKSAPKQGIILLENLRFWPGEEKNSLAFAEEIIESIKPDLFVQDGFAVIHRAHASTDAITKKLPTVAGLLLEKEISNLSDVKDNPEHPFIVLIGGSKVEDKAPLIGKFLQTADHIYVGGKIAADGYAAPSDKITVASDFIADADGAKLDIGQNSTAETLELLKSAKLVLWNGVFGKTEDENFALSSTKIANFLGTHSEIKSIICGGDTVGFVETIKSKNPNLNFTLLSTGGGASLEFLLDRPLPGLENIPDF